MITLEKTQSCPLHATEDGTILIADSGVSLDSVVHHYKLGASAEQIAQKFPGLSLATVYATVAYYLNNEAAVEQYLQAQDRNGDQTQQTVESDPQYQNAASEVRARLLTLKSEARQD
jgi:uncharacterized protein (DUF433 family)